MSNGIFDDRNVLGGLGVDVAAPSTDRRDLLRTTLWDGSAFAIVKPPEQAAATGDGGGLPPIVVWGLVIAAIGGVAYFALRSKPMKANRKRRTSKAARLARIRARLRQPFKPYPGKRLRKVPPARYFDK